MFPSSNTSIPEQFRAADLEFLGAGNNLVLTYMKGSQTSCFLPLEVVELLKTCRQFRTIDEHIQSYCHERQASIAMKGAMRRELQKLVQGGYLISRSSVLADFQEPIEKKPSQQITCMGVPTSERVEALQKGLPSYIENCQHFGRTCNFVVMDDSVHSQTRSAYRRMLQSLQSRYGVSIAYAGLEEKMAFARRLSEVGHLPLESVIFACVGDKRYGITTVGANRNALLLHTIGECIFSADDDTLCRIAAVPGAQTQSVSFSSKGSPIETWFFPSREDLLRSVHFVEQDILALHEQWLGRNPRMSVIQAEQRYEIEFDQVEPRFLQRLARGQGKVILTMNGAVGDCRWDNPHHYLFLRGDTFKRLTYSEQNYHSARATREVLQAVKQVTVTESAGPLFATYIGLDNREFLPPFMPLGRAEDIAFGMILTKCFEAAYAVQLPCALYHAPPEARFFSEQHMFSVGFNTWVASCIGLFEPGFAHSPSERLCKLGRHLEELGRLPKATFEEFVREHTWRTMSSLISELEERLQNREDPLPAFWLQDARALIARARESALVPITDLYTLRGGTEALQHLLIQFGKMLEYWPTMLEVARQMRTEGYRLAQPL